MCGSRRAAAGRSPRAREDRWTYGGEPARDVVFFQNKPTTMRHNTDMFGAASIHTLEQQSERCVWCPALRWAYPVRPSSRERVASGSHHNKRKYDIPDERHGIHEDPFEVRRHKALANDGRRQPDIVCGDLGGVHGLISVEGREE
jgi:hypothetical protein